MVIFDGKEPRMRAYNQLMHCFHDITRWFDTYTIIEQTNIDMSNFNTISKC